MMPLYWQALRYGVRGLPDLTSAKAQPCVRRAIGKGYGPASFREEPQPPPPISLSVTEPMGRANDYRRSSGSQTRRCRAPEAHRWVDSMQSKEDSFKWPNRDY